MTEETINLIKIIGFVLGTVSLIVAIIALDSSKRTKKYTREAAKRMERIRMEKDRIMLSLLYDAVIIDIDEKQLMIKMKRKDTREYIVAFISNIERIEHTKNM